MPRANLTVIGDVSHMSKPGEGCWYSQAGLIWASQTIREIKSAVPNAKDRNSQLCDYCKKLSDPIHENGLHHRPGLVALNSSAISCDVCFILLMSLDGHRPLDTWVTHSENISTDDDDDEDNESLALKIQVSEREPDEIIIYEISGGQCLGPSSQRRYRAVWRKEGVVGFQFPGDIVGVAQIQGHGSTSTARAIWAGEDGEEEEMRLDVINEWMEQCRINHPQCKHRLDGWLPTRVIDVDGTESSDTVRLVHSMGLKGTFTALSYCWGSSVPAVTTTKKTVTKNMQSITVADLPRIHQDAIRVTRKLNIRYLWIDAWCIVQDDPDEWQREAYAMHHIYSNAAVTLAATSAGDCNDMLVHPFRPSFHDTIRTENGYQAFRLAHIHSRSPDLILHTRAWTLQEACLSRRILNFTSRQIIWSCASATLSEDGMFDGIDELTGVLPPMLHSFDAQSSIAPSQWYELWRRLAEIYSQRRLSFERDKTSALAGITIYFSDKLLDEPCYGVWRKQLVPGLLWKTKADSSGHQLANIPSWSWLATSNPIEYDQLYVKLGTSDGYRIIPKLHVLPRPAAWTDIPMISKKRDVRLSICGPMLTVRAVQETPPTSQWFDLVSVEHPGQRLASVFSDYILDTLPLDVRCLHVASIEGDETKSLHGSKIVLVVAPSSGNWHECRRLGLLVLHGEGKDHELWTMLDKAVVQAVEFV